MHINNQQPVMHIDATPDAGYPLRILRAYREHCNLLWSGSTDNRASDPPIVLALNELQRKRAALLDRAIEILSAAEPVVAPDAATPRR